MLLKKDNIRTRLEVTGSNSNKIKKEMALLEKLDLAVDKDASDMCGRVGLGTSNITAHWGLTPLKNINFLNGVLDENIIYYRKQRQNVKT